MIQINEEIMSDWPIYAFTLREILLKLGFEEDSESIFLPKGEDAMKLLNSYPRLLKDDGMGYGVDEEYISEVDTEVYNEDENLNVPVFNIFREKVGKQWKKQIQQDKI